MLIGPLLTGAVEVASTTPRQLKVGQHVRVPRRWDPWEEDGGGPAAEIRERLAVAMEERGWTADPDGRLAFPWALYGAFERAAYPDFVARVVLRPTGSTQVDGRTTSRITADVGVTYTPLDRLRWVLTGELSREGVFDDIVNVADLPSEIRYVDNDEAAMDRALSRLIELIDAHALAFALEHASVESLLEIWSATGTERTVHRPYGKLDDEVERVPALLAAAGRLDEAGTALEHYLGAGGDLVTTRRYRRFARQLLRYLDANGEVADPSEPPRARFDPADRPEWPGVWTTLRAGRVNERERSRAAGSVRERAHGQSRQELRSMLNDEVERRHLEVSPSWIEMTLNEFQHPELGAKRSSWTSGLKVLFSFGRYMADVWHEGGHSELPAWLEPPDRAGYPMRSSHRRLTAVLPGEADRTWLDHVVESMPLHFRPGLEQLQGVLPVDVWLTWDAASDAADSILAVFLGDHRIGEIARKDVDDFRVVMERAAERDELPWTSAKLSFGYLNESGYLLEVPLPAVA